VKEGIHPEWHPQAKIVCASCGTEWHIGSTVPELRVDICSNCHPFYTGEQRIVDTEGQVDRFMKRLQIRDQREAEVRAKEEARVNADIPLEELELGKRYIKIFNEAGINLVSDLITKLEDEGDDAILELPGIGVKVLADAKRRINEKGYQVIRT
jgi:large subunit ribosomal protein L31